MPQALLTYWPSRLEATPLLKANWIQESSRMV